VVNLDKRGALATLRGPLTNTQRKTEMMMNPGMDGWTKTLNHRKIMRKAYKNKNLLKNKRMLKPKQV